MQKQPPKEKHFHSAEVIPHRVDLSPSHQRGSPDVIRVYASVTHWGNIMFCLFFWMYPSPPALCASSCLCRKWDCPQEVQCLWQGVGGAVGQVPQIQLSTFTGPLSDVSLSSASSVEGHAEVSSPRTICSQWARFSLQTQIALHIITAKTQQLVRS